MSTLQLVLVALGGFVTLVTLTSSLAAVFRVGRLRTLHDTAERAAAAWEEERNAAVSKAERLARDIHRLEGRVKELEAVNARLQERTDLTHYFDQQEKNHHQVIDELHQVSGGFQALATSIETLAAMLRPLTAAQ